MLENTFSRTTSNIAKAGAYYTEKEHCSRIAQMFNWPDEEVSILEPSAGDGSAVIEVTKFCMNRKIFAVELMERACEELRQNDNILEVLCSDFLSTKISNNVFSFCFANPPYILEEDGRMELAFMKRIVNYIALDGIIVYVIPISVATNEEFVRFYLSNFEHLYDFRFSDNEYDKYKQIVFIGRKGKVEQGKGELIKLLTGKSKDDFQIIPKEWKAEKIEVFPSKESDVVIFTTSLFDRNNAFNELLKKNPQSKNLKKLTVSEYSEGDIPRPPVMPNRNTLYLLSTLGCGSGITGSVENKDIHLQRGNAEVKEYSFDELDEDGSVVCVTQKSTKVSVTILENDGTFTVLE